MSNGFYKTTLVRRVCSAKQVNVSVKRYTTPRRFDSKDVFKYVKTQASQTLIFFDMQFKCRTAYQQH